MHDRGVGGGQLNVLAVPFSTSDVKFPNTSANDLQKVDSLLGSASKEVSLGERRIQWHGALMTFAWMLLLPLGSLFPKHR